MRSPIRSLACALAIAWLAVGSTVRATCEPSLSIGAQPR
jgi:hypothetical protein